MTHDNGPRGGQRLTFEVVSADGTPIAVARDGMGPPLLIVHGGTGDRTRWTPLFAHLTGQHSVYAMDRRAHGQSGDGPRYSLNHEVEDVLAVMASLNEPAVLFGHSFGGVLAYEAALRSPQVAALVLYEPALRVREHAHALARMEAAIRSGDRQAATATFFREIVQVDGGELDVMRSRASWPHLVSTIETSMRQHRALAAHPWDPTRARDLRTPSLLILGEQTRNGELRESVRSLAEALPVNEVAVMKGQGHNAMDTEPAALAALVTRFLAQRRWSDAPRTQTPRSRRVDP